MNMSPRDCEFGRQWPQWFLLFSVCESLEWTVMDKVSTVQCTDAASWQTFSDVAGFIVQSLLTKKLVGSFGTRLSYYSGTDTKLIFLFLEKLLFSNPMGLFPKMFRIFKSLFHSFWLSVQEDWYKIHQVCLLKHLTRHRWMTSPYNSKRLVALSPVLNTSSLAQMPSENTFKAQADLARAYLRSFQAISEVQPSNLVENTVFANL